MRLGLVNQTRPEGLLGGIDQRRHGNIVQTLLWANTIGLATLSVRPKIFCPESAVKKKIAIEL